MSWVDKAHRENKRNKEIDRALNSPKYKMIEQKKLDKEYIKAFHCFLLISFDYMYCRLGFRKKRLLRYLNFVMSSVHSIEKDPEYFRLLNEALEEETGINILGELESGRTNEG